MLIPEDFGLEKERTRWGSTARLSIAMAIHRPFDMRTHQMLSLVPHRTVFLLAAINTAFVSVIFDLVGELKSCFPDYLAVIFMS